MFKNTKVRIAIFTVSFAAGIGLIVGGAFVPALFVPGAAFIGGSLSMFQSAFSTRGSCASTPSVSTPTSSSSTSTHDISTDSRASRDSQIAIDNRMLFLFEQDRADTDTSVSHSANRPSVTV